MKRTTMKRHLQSGWITIELVVAIGVLVAILAALGSILYSSGNYNRILWARQQCLAAGQAQLDCIAKTGKPVPPADAERLWPGIQCTLETEPGTGPWEPLRLVRVGVRARIKNKTVAVVCSRYLRVEE
jgi:type II secretory pathway pseudopilin PulG